MGSSNWLVRFRPVVILGLVIALVSGTLLGLSVVVLSISRVRFVSKLLFSLSGWLLALPGVRIASLAYRVDPGGWRGYIVRVAVSTACALAIGMWAQLCYWLLGPLVGSLLGQLEPSPTADLLVDIALGLGYFLPTLLALVLSAGRPRK